MAQQLSVNVALVEDQGSFQALTWLTTIYNPVPGDQMPSSNL